MSRSVTMANRCAAAAAFAAVLLAPTAVVATCGDRIVARPAGAVTSASLPPHPAAISAGVTTTDDLDHTRRG